MAVKRNTLLLWTAMAALLCQSVAIYAVTTASFEDEKHYYSPEPHPPSAPKVSVSPPYRAKPPVNCGTPPTRRSPAPSGRRGGYYRSPPYATPITPPATVTPPTLTPPVVTTPTTPIPPITASPPPFVFDPHSPPFTCIFWKNHPTLVWGLVGWWGTLGNAFGVPSVPGFGSSTNVMQALSNPRTDGYGDLYREGTAALLNAMSHKKFPLTTSQVKQSFVAALVSDKAAEAQARIFKMANEGQTRV